MVVKHILVLFFSVGLSHGVIYDYFEGVPVSEDLLAYYEGKSLIGTCTIDIKPCSETDRKRVDGSCNNLKYPSRGTYFNPQLRLLPAQFYNGSFARKAVSGNDLPLPRYIRVNMLGESRSIHKDLTQTVPAYGIVMFSDIGVPHDSANMLSKTTYCCEKERMNSYECTPNIIPEDDPIHSITGIRCMNSTRPLTFQMFSCTNYSVPTPIAQATSALDLSNIYNANNGGDKAVRSFVGGLLATEEENGKIWLPNGPIAGCPLNEAGETRCFKNFFNAVLSVQLFQIWFVRYHNLIATELAAVNPFWDDEKLFQVARDINIACAMQIYYYEWLVALEGRDHLIKAGIISKDGGFRDIYDENSYPLITMDFTLILRWFHMLQDATVRMYDTKGNYVKEYPMLNLTFRTGFLAKDNNMEYCTQSTFRQACHNNDHSIDYEMAERGFPGVQQSLDITAGDINKCRNFGMAPYIDYVHLFTGKNITSFDDLLELMPVELVRKLELLYEHVADIDLIVGVWAEKKMKDGRIPNTVASIINDQMLRNIKGDRHWFERPNRPHAFTEAQLKEIRKATVAQLLCSVGDGVSEIQKNVFFNISPENPLVSCSEIPRLDFTVWADPTSNSS